MSKEEEYWYCQGCQYWGKRVIDQPTPEICDIHPNRVIKVLGKSRVAIMKHIPIIFSFEGEVIYGQASS